MQQSTNAQRSKKRAFSDKERIAAIRKRYTLVDGERGDWRAELVVEPQSFYVCSGTTKKQAQWFAGMLAIALDRLIEQNA